MNKFLNKKPGLCQRTYLHPFDLLHLPHGVLGLSFLLMALFHGLNQLFGFLEVCLGTWFNEL